ncbi:YbaB/EbfC family nucleoid-associated protein [Lentzea jiangxiensis]|uniref:YbaB/EbfC DNA-binding family protein n=1 Tax=Lentzea jiangxiensis TaxID=641025 RepID=A0A1H0SLB7_9PSEU|nr:YbaB/EbfC family nucleoid-associated protein [Lentzea jiangxiensis]SDP42028.1 YbaB/EbfC DNA-binding family protein [Lentzea jiangxiensis]
MSSSLEDQFEKTLADYRQKRAGLKDLRARMAEMSSTATAPRNVVTATVDTHGQITGVSFPSSAYKNMTPTELANIVCDTVRKAQTMAREQLAEMMEPMMPAGMSMKGREPGKIDIDRLFPEDPEEGLLFSGLNQ